MSGTATSFGFQGRRAGSGYGSWKREPYRKRHHKRMSSAFSLETQKSKVNLQGSRQEYPDLIVLPSPISNGGLPDPEVKDSTDVGPLPGPGAGWRAGEADRGYLAQVLLSHP